MKPTFQAEGVTLYHADCMELMAQFPDKHFDLAIVDPPYGLNIAKEKPRVSGRWNYTPKAWDASPPDAAYFKELERVSTHRVIWGGNYFTLPPARCWAIWDKQQPVDNFAAGEMAWTSFDEVVRMFRFSFSANKDKIHVTQKPVELYAWLLCIFAKPGQRILDTHFGSGSIGIACRNFGCELVASEIDADYVREASERLRREFAQPVLFKPEAPVATQEQLI